MTQVTHFGYLGNDFQLKVLSQIICDRQFGLNIIEIINPKYFDNQHFRQIASILKNHYEKFNNAIPTISGLKESISVDIKDEIQREYLISIVNELPEKSLEDIDATQDRALKFCRQQELKKAISKVEEIMKRGDFENYDSVREIVNNALAIGDTQDESTDLDEGFDEVMEEDYRKPQRTGIYGLDQEIDGGPARGEIGMLLMPKGIGKTSLLTKIANTAYEDGLSVLQMFFEDNEKDIKRKHYTCASGIPMKELPKNKEFVTEKVKQQKEQGGSLRLKKCKFGTTVRNIRQYIHYLRGKGIKIDMLIIDYLDCLSPSKDIEDQTGNESIIIRELESLGVEENIFIWTAVQTGRGGFSSDFVSADKIQGSIRRVQVAHLIISVNKSMPQKELNLANLAILNIRYGGTGEGKMFENMTFNNGTMEFRVEQNSLISISDYEVNKEKRKEEEGRKMASEVYSEYKESRGKLK